MQWLKSVVTEVSSGGCNSVTVQASRLKRRPCHCGFHAVCIWVTATMPILQWTIAILRSVSRKFRDELHLLFAICSANISMWHKKHILEYWLNHLNVENSHNFHRDPSNIDWFTNLFYNLIMNKHKSGTRMMSFVILCLPNRFFEDNRQFCRSYNFGSMFCLL